MILDSNIIIYEFQPQYRDSDLERFLAQGEFSASSLTRLEVMGFWRSSDVEFQQFEPFFGALRIFAISDEIVERAIRLRRQRSICLADAIIAATALIHQLP